MFGWILIRHLNIESIFWVVHTAEAYPLAHSFLLGFCETGRKKKKKKSCCLESPAQHSARLSPLQGSTQALSGWLILVSALQASPAALGGSEPSESQFFYWFGGNLDQTYILPLKIDRISCLFSFAVLLSWQEYFLYQRTKSLSFTWLSHWFPLAEWPY